LQKIGEHISQAKPDEEKSPESPKEGDSKNSEGNVRDAEVKDEEDKK